MTKLIGALVVSGSLAFVPALARSQEGQAEGWSDLGLIPDSEDPGPATAAPADPPPPPEAQAVPQPQYQSAPAPAPQAAVPPGQWVYTQQYGWIWMPYADAYTYVPDGGYGAPYAYVYYPVHSCWLWVAAPWVWGIGPWPFFGAWGPAHFAWYGHGWWRTPDRWHYAPRYGAYASFRPAPAPAFRGGVRAPAPAFRGGVRAAPAPAFRGGGVRAAPAPAFRGGGVRASPPAGFRAGAGFRAAPGPYRGGFGSGSAAPAPAFRGGGPAFGGGRGFGHGGGAPAIGGRGGGSGWRGGSVGHGGAHLGRGRG